MRLSKVKAIGDLLGTIEGLPVGHYEYFGDEIPYCVWAEDHEPSSVEADNHKREQAIQGTVDLYTKREYDPYADAIQEALRDHRVSFYLNSVQYEDETGLVHFEWVWTI